MRKNRTYGDRQPGVKIEWTEKTIQFLIDNWENINNRQLSDELGFGITAVRIKLYELGFKRMEMEYWTEEQIKFLLNNYKKIGDQELSEIFEQHWKKKKAWTNKHIEKKRKYLKLNRTSGEIEAIRERNKKAGRFAFCPINRWITQGVFPEGTIGIWNHSDGAGVFKVIKLNGVFVHYAHWLYQRDNGKMKPGHVVGFKDRDNMNVIPENLEQITRAEHARRNGELRRNKYPEDLRETIYALNQLNTLILKLQQ